MECPLFPNEVLKLRRAKSDATQNAHKKMGGKTLLPITVIRDFGHLIEQNMYYSHWVETA